MTNDPQSSQQPDTTKRRFAQPDPFRKIGSLKPHPDGGWHGIITPKDGEPLDIRLYPYGDDYEVISDIHAVGTLRREGSLHHWRGRIDGVLVRLYAHNPKHNNIPEDIIVVKQIMVGQERKAGQHGV
jgi:hypothetical protein